MALSVRPSAWPVLALALGLCRAQIPTAPQGTIPTFGTTVFIGSGLRGKIYAIPPDSEWLPNFKKLHPLGTIYTTALNVPPRSFMEGFPGVTQRFEWFAIDYTGSFWIEKPGTYRFALVSDDGSKLYIDGSTVIDDDGNHPPVTVDGKRNLKRGRHSIRVSYYQGPRFGIALMLGVAPPGEKWRIFNTDDFEPPHHPDDGKRRGR